MSQILSVNWVTVVAIADDVRAPLEAWFIATARGRRRRLDGLVDGDHDVGPGQGLLVHRDLHGAVREPPVRARAISIIASASVRTP